MNFIIKNDYKLKFFMAIHMKYRKYFFYLSNVKIMELFILLCKIFKIFLYTEEYK